MPCALHRGPKGRGGDAAGVAYDGLDAGSNGLAICILQHKGFDTTDSTADYIATRLHHTDANRLRNSFTGLNSGRDQSQM